MHPWIGAGPEDRKRILNELGLSSIDDLFGSLPSEICTERIDFPNGRDEKSVLGQLRTMADANTELSSCPSFLGAGVYCHVQPSVVDAVLSRAEFFTSYTPYQPEISQGTLQAIFEFQSLLCELTGMEVANASLYDGATALVESVLFCHRVLRGKKNRVVLSAAVHPMYRQVLSTYTGPLGLEVVIAPLTAEGTTDVEKLRELAGEEACCLAVQSPNVAGVIENLPDIVEAAHGSGALAIHLVTEAVSFGLLKAGGHFGFDVVCGEAQSFGVAVGFGGPHLGFFACPQKYVRQMPGRLAGETVDEEGQRAFCLTLSTREQHIRRAKATSNICTNQGLMALAATVWLEAVGGSGLRTMATSCLSRAEALKKKIAKLGGRWRLAYPESPTFNEMLILGPGTGDELVDRLADEGVLAGVSTSRWADSLPDGILVAVTECNSADDIEVLCQALGRVA
jgi:glycine dehydrogenase subunit 1